MKEKKGLVLRMRDVLKIYQKETETFYFHFTFHVDFLRLDTTQFSLANVETTVIYRGLETTMDGERLLMPHSGLILSV